MAELGFSLRLHRRASYPGLSRAQAQNRAQKRALIGSQLIDIRAHPDRLWLSPPPNLALLDDEVHVWRASLDAPPELATRLRNLLAPDEIDRAERFRFERDRVHFTVARGWLRAILSRYVNTPAKHIRLQYNTFGKPALHTDGPPHLIRFNLSHSRGVAVYAVASVRDVGIDLEFVRTNIAHTQIARHTFSTLENIALHSLSPGVQPMAFFNCWTRKEAYIKARGTGMSLPLDEFAVSLMPEEPPRLLYVAGAPEEVERWSMRALEPVPGYVGALAVEGNGWKLASWECDVLP